MKKLLAWSAVIVAIIGMVASIVVTRMSDSSREYVNGVQLTAEVAATPTMSMDTWQPIGIDSVKAAEYGLVVSDHGWPEPRSTVNPSPLNFTIFLYRQAAFNGMDANGDPRYDGVLCNILYFPPQDPEGIWDKEYGITSFDQLLSSFQPTPGYMYSSGSWELVGLEGNVLEFIAYTERVLFQDSACINGVKRVHGGTYSILTTDGRVDPYRFSVLPDLVPTPVPTP